MKTSRTLLVIASLGLLAGCTDRAAEPTGSAQAATPEAGTAHTLGASTGDVTPTGLYTRNAIAIEPGAAWSSQALNPIDTLGAGYAPVTTSHTESLKVIPAGSTGSFQIPVDTTAGESTIFLVPQANGEAAVAAAAANVDVIDPSGATINARSPKMANAVTGETTTTPMTVISLAGHPAGVYTVSLHQASTVGMVVEGRFQSSSIVMTLTPSSMQHLLGNEEYVEATLSEAGKPITGAHLTSGLVHGETLASVAPVSFTEVGNGVYRAAIHPLFNEQSAISAYLADVVAEGTSPSGVAFSRHGRTGFHFGIPTARVGGVVATRTNTDAQGFITGFDVDVKVDSTSVDRLELSGRLTVLGADGNEHPISVAHYGQGFGNGSQVVTLHFDAGDVRMTKAEGDFMVRDIQLFSLGTNTLVSRDLAASNHVFAGISRARLLKHATFSASQLELVQEGVLFND